MNDGRRLYQALEQGKPDTGYFLIQSEFNKTVLTPQEGFSLCSNFHYPLVLLQVFYNTQRL